MERRVRRREGRVRPRAARRSDAAGGRRRRRSCKRSIGRGPSNMRVVCENMGGCMERAEAMSCFGAQRECCCRVEWSESACLRAGGTFAARRKWLRSRGTLRSVRYERLKARPAERAVASTTAKRTNKVLSGHDRRAPTHHSNARARSCQLRRHRSRIRHTRSAGANTMA